MQKKNKNSCLSVRRQINMNTGERIHKSPKDYNRKENKVDLRKIEDYER